MEVEMSQEQLVQGRAEVKQEGQLYTRLLLQVFLNTLWKYYSFFQDSTQYAITSLNHINTQDHRAC